MIKVIVFDLDDTLINESEFTFSAFEEISNFIANKLGKKAFNIYQHLLHLYKLDKAKIFNRLFDSLKIEYTDNAINELVQMYRNHKPNLKLSQSNKILIKKLKKQGFKLGIITDGFKETQNNKIRALKLDQLFDYIIVTDELGPNRQYWKPHEKSFILMKEYFDCNYGEMIYVGDNVNKDFDAPIKLGINSIHILNHEGVYTDVNHMKNLIVIRNLNEICGLIEGNFK